MCCNNSCRSRCGSSCWNSCSAQNGWTLARTGSSCYLSVPQFLFPSSAGSEEDSAQRGGHRFVVSGTIDHFRLLDGCGCGCSCQ